MAGMEPTNEMLRTHLVELLEGKSAHLNMDAVFEGIRDEEWAAKPTGAPHSLWQLVEHMRIALDDLVVFSNDPAYRAPQWPEDYWPNNAAPPSPEAARESLEGLRAANRRMIALVQAPETDLFARIPWGDGQTILREAMLAADHNSYHLGQAVLLRKLPAR